MTSLTQDDFPTFFRECWGYEPYPWQIRLVEGLIRHHRWPRSIGAPTGSGKTAVIDAHVFAQALMPGVLPRRLVVCVNRRSLVDAHAERAHALIERMGASRHPVVEAVKAAGMPQIVRLRGGLSPQREWILDPSAPIVMTITPDMWGSRVLFRGYGDSRLARARSAGLLSLDTTLIVDEAHLNRQLVVTARDLADFVKHDAAAVGVPGLHVCEMSGTLPPGAPGISVAARDLNTHEHLRRVLMQPKPVTLATLPTQPPRVNRAYVHSLADLAQDLMQENECVGVLVNHVDTAVRVADQLRRRHGPDAVACWVGRMRPMDIEALREQHGELFGVTDSGTRPRFMVATQTIEVGMDVDFCAMVSELAPVSSLLQRAGRVNRHGKRDQGPVTIVMPETIRERPPYRIGDLQAAAAWLKTHHDLAAHASRDVPATTPKRAAYSRLSREQVELFAHTTTTELFAPVDLGFWLRDDLDLEVEPVSVVMRDNLGDDTSEAGALLEATGVEPEEMFPVTIGEADQVLRHLSRVFRIRDDGVTVLDDCDDLRPGDVVVIDRAPLTLCGVFGQWDRHDQSPVVTLWPTSTTAEDGVIVDESCDVGPEWDVREVGRRRVIRARDRRSQDATVRQVWSPRRTPITLDGHSNAVAERCRHIATACGLRPELIEALTMAGLDHDLGKADSRFQRWTLGNRSSQLWAKSGDRSTQAALRAQASSPLVTGWRHEQVSAAMSWARREDHELSRDLVARLVGTSHGYGRMIFPHPSTDLVSPEYDPCVNQALEDLFETGAGWADLMDSTHERYGLWGCAYLEAILRGADGAVSAEG